LTPTTGWLGEGVILSSVVDDMLDPLARWVQINVLDGIYPAVHVSDAVPGAPCSVHRLRAVFAITGPRLLVFLRIEAVCGGPVQWPATEGMLLRMRRHICLNEVDAGIGTVEEVCVLYDILQGLCIKAVPT